MTSVRRCFETKALMLMDLGILVLSYAIAAVQIWHLSGFASFAAFISMRIKVLNLLLALVIFYSWHTILSAFDLYGAGRHRGRKQEAFVVIKAMAMLVIVLMAVALCFRVEMITLPFVALFWVVSSSILILSRELMRQVSGRLHRHGHSLRHLLIVGTNPRAEAFAAAIESQPELGYKLIGFADEEWIGNRHFNGSGRSIVTGLEGFSSFLKGHVVDEIVIALPIKSFYSEAARIVWECQQQGVIVRGLTSLFDVQQRRITSGELEMAHVLTYSSNLCEGTPLVFKRLIDVIGASVLLILLAPILLIVGIMVRLESPGPALFVQERVGLNKRKFRMFKFRTMVADAEKLQLSLEALNEADGPVFKIKRDPRITRIGKYLRKASVDELPQLLNVLRGEMSLVGPRPLPMRDYQGFTDFWLHRRFSVRPGLTCLWQVTGRSATTFGRWMELDIQYIDNWSLWLDLKILAKTVPAVLVGRGAA
jgi:exopolysaccharide biosynthesis polyprenyl glycosylphosphotransferase